MLKEIFYYLLGGNQGKPEEKRPAIPIGYSTDDYAGGSTLLKLRTFEEINSRRERVDQLLKKYRLTSCSQI